MLLNQIQTSLKQQLEHHRFDIMVITKPQFQLKLATTKLFDIMQKHLVLFYLQIAELKRSGRIAYNLGGFAKSA